MPESVHLCDYPEADIASVDKELDRQMDYTMTSVELGRQLRKNCELPNRQPLREAIIVSVNPDCRSDLEEMKDVIMSELNIKKIIMTPFEIHLMVARLVDMIINLSQFICWISASRICQKIHYNDPQIMHVPTWNNI